MGSADTEEGASASSRRSVTCERGMRVKMASADAEECVHTNIMGVCKYGLGVRWAQHTQRNAYTG